MTALELSLSLGTGMSAALAYRHGARLASIAIGEPIEYQQIATGQIWFTAVIATIAEQTIISTCGIPGGLAFTPIVAGAAIDRLTNIIPDVLLLAALTIGAGAILLLHQPIALTTSALGLALAATLGTCLSKAMPIGRGDIKMLIVVGTIFGPLAALLSICIAILIISAERSIAGRDSWAFGPHIAVGLALAEPLLRNLAQ